jgi:hypothetical protein
VTNNAITTICPTTLAWHRIHAAVCRHRFCLFSVFFSSLRTFFWNAASSGNGSTYGSITIAVVTVVVTVTVGMVTHLGPLHEPVALFQRRDLLRDGWKQEVEEQKWMERKHTHVAWECMV